MKKIIIIAIVSFLSKYSFAQVSGSFSVGGDFDKFYPVSFQDGGWIENVPTNLILGRSSVYESGNWRGSLMAIFNFHVSGWGNGSHFIDADIKPLLVSGHSLVAGWEDVTHVGYGTQIIIWLRGGNTTYNYKSNYAVNPVVYDGGQNPLPFQISNGGQLSFKTTIEKYASTAGKYEARDAYFASNVGIGTTAPDSKLTVAGNIHAQEVKVTTAAGTVPDYVFANDYKLKSLDEVEAYIKKNSHLPEIPSAKEIEKNGLMLAEMNLNLLKKIEELTLYIIEQNKKNEEQSKEIESLRSLAARVLKIENELKQ